MLSFSVSGSSLDPSASMFRSGFPGLPEELDGDFIPKPWIHPADMPPGDVYAPYSGRYWCNSAGKLQAGPTGWGYTTDGWGNNGGYGYTYTDGFGSKTDANGNNRY